MFSVSCFLVGIVTVLLRCSEGSGYDPTEHIYPWPLPNDRQPLFFSLMTSFSETFDSSGIVPGVNVALDIINSNLQLLNGYSLHYILSDSNVGGSMFESITNCDHSSICSVRRPQHWMPSSIRFSLKLNIRSWLSSEQGAHQQLRQLLRYHTNLTSHRFDSK